jgi:hypothetical protein
MFVQSYMKIGKDAFLKSEWVKRLNRKLPYNKPIRLNLQHWILNILTCYARTKNCNHPAKLIIALIDNKITLLTLE